MAQADFAALRPHLDDLASDDAATRLNASRLILLSLNKAPTSLVEQVLDRLFNGLASGRKSARIGFSITLAELLSTILHPEGHGLSMDGLSFSRVLELLRSRTRTNRKLPGQDRNYHLGRLFGLQAIFRSRGIYEKPISQDEWRQVLDLVFDLTRKKSWLREECGWILYSFVQDSKGSAHGAQLAETLIEKLCANNMALTPEGVAIWLAVAQNHVDAHLPRRPWHRQDPLRLKNDAELSRVMKDASAASGAEHDHPDNKMRQRGVWSPKPNFAWEAVINHLIGAFSESKRFTLATFWQRIVDENLFTASASQERKHLGLTLFAKLIKDAPAEMLPDIFTTNLMRCLINHASNKERYLHRAAVKCLEAMPSRVGREPGRLHTFVVGLLTGNGTPIFEQLTKTKTVTTMISISATESLREIIPLLLENMRRPGTTDPKVADSYRRAIGDILMSVLGALKLSGADALVEVILAALCEFAYASVPDSWSQPYPPLSTQTREYCRTKLSSFFARQIAAGETNGDLEGPTRLLWKLEEQKEAGSWDLIMEFDDSIEAMRSSTLTQIQDLKTFRDMVEGKQKRHVQMMILLYSLTIFELYNGNHDALSALSELDVLCAQVMGAETAMEGFSDLLVEVLLALVTKPSQLLRKLAEQVFGVFTSELTDTSLEILYDVLDKRESAAGQQELFDHQDEASETGDGTVTEPSRKRKANHTSSGSEAGDGSSEDDDDADGANANGVNANAHASEGSDEEMDLESEDDDSSQPDLDAPEGPDMDEAHAKLNSALGELFKTRGFDADMPDQGDEDDSDTEEMDDEAMFQLDERMAQVFRERLKRAPNKKQGQKEARENVVQLKNRALDFLEIYIKQEYSQHLCTTALLPLLRLIRTTRTKQVSERASGLVRLYAQKLKGAREDVLAVVPKDPETRQSPTKTETGNEAETEPPSALTRDEREQKIDVDWLHLLCAVHDEAGRGGGSRLHSAACSQASLLFVRLLTRTSRRHRRFGAITRIYADTQSRWLADRDNFALQPSFFVDFVNWGFEFGKQQSAASRGDIL